jgi:hypothetical protein
LIATLLPDPAAGPKPAEMSDDEWPKEVVQRRRALCKKIGGKVVQKVEKKQMPSGRRSIGGIGGRRSVLSLLCQAGPAKKNPCRMP